MSKSKFAKLREWVISGFVGNGVWWLIGIIVLSLVPAASWFWESIKHYPIQSTILISLIVIELITCLIVGRAWHADSRRLTREMNTSAEALILCKENLKYSQDLADNINKLDLRLLELLSLMNGSSQELDREVKQIVRTAFKLAIKILSNVYSASLFRPDVAEILTVWAYHELDEDNTKIKCYGGERLPPGITQRGVAGEAYHTKKVLSTRISENNGIWEADKPYYIFLNRETFESGQEEIYAIPYRSVACVPLIRNSSEKPLGVICFNSIDSTAFESDEAKIKLQVLGDRFMVVLSMYDKLREIRQTGEGFKIAPPTP